MNQQAWIDKKIGPRVVGGTYYNGYWGDTYTVEDIYRAPDASQWGMRVRWSDGHTTVHCTGWDAKRDRVVGTAAVPEHAPAGMLAVRVGSDPWTMVPLDDEPGEDWQGHPYQDAPCHDCGQPIRMHQRTDNGPICPHPYANPVGWDVIDTSTDEPAGDYLASFYACHPAD